MKLDEFWHHVEVSRKAEPRKPGAVPDLDYQYESVQAEKLYRRLLKLSAKEIISFQRHLEAARQEAYRYDLWAVAHIISGGCSEEDFDWFIGWLISQGREFFEAVLVSPERAAERVKQGERPLHEDFLAVAFGAYGERARGHEMQSDVPVDDELWRPCVLKGSTWKEEDLPRLFPDLVKRFRSSAR